MAFSRRLPDPKSRERRAWGWAAALQLPIVGLELVFAPRTHSWTLWVDMLHNANDVLLLLLSAWPSWASVITHRELDDLAELRWRERARVVNAVTLMASGLFAAVSGYLRFHGLPVEVNFAEALPVAIASGLINGLIYVVIRPFRHHGHVEVLSWHQFWDVLTSIVAVILLWAGTHMDTPQVDSVAAMIIGTAMFLHWPLHRIFERNGHAHCSH